MNGLVRDMELRPEKLKRADGKYSIVIYQYWGDVGLWKYLKTLVSENEDSADSLILAIKENGLVEAL